MRSTPACPDDGARVVTRQPNGPGVAAHGLPRNNADKRKAVQMLLDDAEWSAKSNVWIGEQCRVNESLVRSMRPATGSVKPKVKGKDGKLQSAKKATSKRTEPTPLATNQNGANDFKGIEIEGFKPIAPAQPPARRGCSNPTAQSGLKS